MKKLSLNCLFIAAVIFSAEAAAEKPPEKAVVGTFTDIRDKKTYKTVKIDNQVWMAENLNMDLLSSKCYDNKPDNCQKYGRLYDWKTAMKACPNGWYLPSEVDWSYLMQFVNPDCPFIGDCTDAGTKLKAVSGWNSNRNGTDNYGFAALPGGIGLSDGKFRDAGNGGLWWSSSDDAKKASRISMDIDGPNVHRNSSDKNLLFSIRCLQGTPAQTEKGSFTDSRDKKTYKTIKIGKQTWMAENLNVKTDTFWCYGNNESNCQKYGKLYDLETARKACPSGWHLPSKEEWEVLVVVTGLKRKPNASCYAGTVWTGARKLQESFAALPGGSRCAPYGIEVGDCDEWMGNVGVSGNWWASDVDEEDGGATSIEIENDEANLCMSMSRYGSGFGYSVRCVKD